MSIDTVSIVLLIVLLLGFYLFPIIIAVAITLFSLKQLKKEAKKFGINKNTIKDWLNDKWKKKREQHALQKKPLWKDKIIIKQILIFADAIFFIYIFPHWLLRMVLLLKYGNLWDWKLPFISYNLLDLVYLAIAFASVVAGYPAIGIFIGMIVAIVSVKDVIDYFITDRKGFKLINIPLHKFHITSFIYRWIILGSVYALFYFGLGTFNLNAFSEEMTVIDSFYYSFATITTVGYGDIHAISNVAKIISISEMIAGFCFAIFAVSLIISVWIQRKSESEKQVMEKKNEKEVEEENEVAEDIVGGAV